MFNLADPIQNFNASIFNYPKFYAAPIYDSFDNLYNKTWYSKIIYSFIAKFGKLSNEVEKQKQFLFFTIHFFFF